MRIKQGKNLCGLKKNSLQLKVMSYSLESFVSSDPQVKNLKICRDFLARKLIISPSYSNKILSSKIQSIFCLFQFEFSFTMSISTFFVIFVCFVHVKCQTKEEKFEDFKVNLIIVFWETFITLKTFS